MIVPRPPATVEYFLTECKRYEDLQSKRISHSQLEHLAEATPYNYCKDLIALIRDTVRNELQTFFDPNLFENTIFMQRLLFTWRRTRYSGGHTRSTTICVALLRLPF